ncbi:STAS domain-containing protein [Streptomyces sp. HM190]|uniref:STAS domain-containing protein n=1 Tax=Streptomyces sp. HM190 TaxID=2695266 RepID=UPI001F2BECBD|nr:STAS domain-containing protein [Streptomyces sp. HM190]
MDVDDGEDGTAFAPRPGGAALEIRSLSGRPGIRAAGEINVITRPSWEQALRKVASSHGDVSHVELSGLMSIDVGGAAVLAVTAQRLTTGRIVVHRPPPELTRILDLFWPGLATI